MSDQNEDETTDDDFERFMKESFSTTSSARKSIGDNAYMDEPHVVNTGDQPQVPNRWLKTKPQLQQQVDVHPDSPLLPSDEPEDLEVKAGNEIDEQTTISDLKDTKNDGGDLSNDDDNTTANTNIDDQHLDSTNADDYVEDFESEAVTTTDSKNLEVKLVMDDQLSYEVDLGQQEIISMTTASNTDEHVHKSVSSKDVEIPFKNSSNVRSVDEILLEAKELMDNDHNRAPEVVDKPMADQSKDDARRSSSSIDGSYRNVASRLDFNHLNQLLQEERRRNSKLKYEIESRERSLRRELDHQKLSYDDHLARQREQNAHLATKLKILESKSSQEEQEQLFKGFQKENKRLYHQVKHLEATLKEVESNKRPLIMSKAIQTEIEPDREVPIPQEDKEMASLKKRMVCLEREVRQKNMENDSMARVIGAKERAIEISRNRMKQLECLLQVKNPNSISALVLAASGTDMTDESAEDRVVQLLEKRIHDLEEQLGTRPDGESLMEIQRQFENIKSRYEEKIEQLEHRLLTEESAVSVKGSRRPQTSITALEKELDHVRERHRNEVTALKKELQTLWNESKRKNDNQDTSDKFANLASKNRTLIAQNEAKDETIRDLESKLSSMIANNYQNINQRNTTADENKVQILSKELKNVQSELKKMVESNKALTEANSKLGNCDESLRFKMTAMETHVQEMTTRCLELRRRSDTQEMIIENLREQLSRALVKQEMDKETSVENIALKNRCQKLQEELCRLESQRTPDQRNFLSLQARVLLAEKMYEEKTNYALKHTSSDGDKVNTSTLKAEVDSWKRKFYARNIDLERFRSELDIILEALEELKTQLHCN